MSSKLKISVYITSYNQKAFLKEAIDSVLNQTVSPFEVILVDDCSDDGSQELILEYAKEHSMIRYSFHTVNRGVAQVRRTALEMVKGDYVTYVDGDDLYLPRKLEIESQIIINQSCDIAFSNNIYVNEYDLNNIKWIWTDTPVNLKSHSSMFVKTVGRFFPRSSLFRMELVNYEFLKSIGFHDPNLALYEDYDLRIRMAQRGTFGCTLEPTTKDRINSKGLSTSPRKDHLEALSYIFKKYEKDICELNVKDEDIIRKRIKQILSEVTPKKGRVGFVSVFDKISKKVLKKVKTL
jgi:glycosyltransferase involved in cell wall biosynthesis